MIQKNHQFLPALKIKTEKVFSCETSGCLDSGSCHCCKITHAEVERVNVPEMSFMIWEVYTIGLDDKALDRDKLLAKLFYGGLDVDIYCINRILTKLKVWETEKIWTINIENGYYGEEVSSVHLNVNIIREINKHVSRMLGYDTLKEKLEYCLMVEYARVLDLLSDKDYEMVDIQFSDIQLTESNRNHLDKVTLENLDHYSPERYDDLPRGIVKQVGTKFYIIDGFHRIMRMEDSLDTFKVFSVIG